MTFHFDADAALILVSAKLIGPDGTTLLSMALDTGASRTLINEDVLRSVGYDPDESEVERVPMTTASTVEPVPQLPVDRIESLGQHRRNLLVVAYTLPDDLDFDGLLGLDFLRGLKLNIDFRKGRITVS